MAEDLVERLQMFDDGMEVIVKAATAHLFDQIRKQAGFTDHTLGDLRRLGHPYRMRDGGFFSTKGGKWRAGIRSAARALREAVGAKGSVGHDIKFVHRQSGQLQDNIEMTVTRQRDAVIGLVFVEPSRVPHLQWVIKGTSKMIPRDFIGIGAIRARNGIHQIVQDGLNAMIAGRAL